jgi:hypothetical protein
LQKKSKSKTGSKEKSRPGRHIERSGIFIEWESKDFKEMTPTDILGNINFEYNRSGGLGSTND